MHFAQRAAHYGEILGVNINGAAFHRSKPGHNSITGQFFTAEQVVTAVGNVGLQLVE